ncbi:molybdate ABC transporter substrate-binding protein [Stappia sp. GBMRC 2046]|uniref:Molybdate ABC transporter substrate-binding protein n=1 Tax=Stappia sediminis TaxID=2692190 RepID=A0A7X3LU94_9HYPH|nr:molybdate ABC transporter substrate-binding protein [Stappia sediminis]MXN65232.1 molybdate ABC transporter substrate-binding protein [Stappia sediminis]
MRRLHIAIAAVFALALALASPADAAERLTIFAAASLKDALEAAGKAYARETGTEVVYSFAGTASIARQVEAGAPADLFFSADELWMDHVRHAGAVVPETIITVATNTLVVVAPKTNPEPLELTTEGFLSRLGDRRLAVADTETIPAGRYAKAALSDLNLYEDLAGRLAPMENVRIALATVARGETPLGIVYASDAIAEKDVAVVAEIPEDSHPAIVYPAAVTTIARQGAKEFLAFLKTPQAREAFRAAGLRPVD